MRPSRAFLVMLLFVVSCATTSPPVINEPITKSTFINPDLREDDDAADVIYAVTMRDAKIESSTRTDIPKDAFGTMSAEERQKDTSKEPEPQAPRKIHPLLEKRMAGATEGAAESVVVTFRDDMKIPRFPEPALGESRDSETNKRAMARNEEIVQSLRNAREKDYEARKAMESVGARITEQFWLVRAIEAKMPLAGIRELAERQDVLSIDPVQTEDAPPQNDVVDGRARINSDPYFNLNQTLGFIGLLDTGIRNTHVQFVGPSHIAFLRDCVNGGANCNTGTLNTADDCWNHGTSSAAIITANANQGNAFRGVTAITLDSFKVYPSTFNGTTCTGFLNTTAVVRGFQSAINVLDRVIVAEMQGSGDHTSAISVAADNAFDAGAVIIAANGNNGPNASTVNTPANAHRVIGIGNFDVVTLAQIASQSRGPTSDGRFKPDVQAPTNTDTASTGCPFGVSCAQSNTAQRNFGGTSGATPYGAGAAALVRNFLRGGTGVIEPGFVYAYLIMSGQRTAFDNTTGAGPIRLPVNGRFAISKVFVSNGQVINVPFSVIGAPGRIDAAIWWPETSPQPHNDIDLRLVTPGGSTAAFSLSVNSVYERARANSPAAGTWQIRINGFSVPSAPQAVFLAVSTE
jgi:hypothetical protein